jgi:GMP synthase (glutamine-hydrolysing)
MNAILVSLRDSEDPMVEQERRCFEETAGLARIEVVRAAIEPLDGRVLDADVVFFGGSGAYSVLDDVPWVKRAVEFLTEVVASGTPAWASCFGYQGLALALGGEVVHDMDRQRLGVYRIHREPSGDPLFSVLPATFWARLGHHDHVDRLPVGVTVLATGDEGRPEAFRVDGSNFWGAQFHPELDKHSTYERFQFYRSHYAPEQGDEIDRQMLAAPDTPEPARILKEIVAFARERARSRGSLPP